MVKFDKDNLRGTVLKQEKTDSDEFYENRLDRFRFWLLLVLIAFTLFIFVSTGIHVYHEALEFSANVRLLNRYYIFMLIWLVLAASLAAISLKRRHKDLIHLEKLEETQGRLEYISEHDQLTGLLNRQTAMEYLRQNFGTDSVYSVLLADIVDFQEINETYGHDFGDKILASVAADLIARFNKEDMTIARYGSDEFMIIFAGRHLTASSDEISQIYQIGQHPVSIGSASVMTDTSIGIANSDGVSTPEQLVIGANIALHQARQDGRNTVKVFSPRMRSELSDNVHLKNQIHDALKVNGFYMVYQPKVLAEDGSLAGYEALVRMKNSNISPAVFIPIAAENGWLRQIGRLTTEMVIAQQAEWRDMGHEIHPVSINYSAVQLRDAGYLDYLLDTLNAYNLSPEMVQIEITEGVVLEHKDTVIRLLNRFRDAGIKLLLDDFGTGYSSLSYLTYIPVDAVKVDKSLVDTFMENKQRTSLMQDIIRFGHDMNEEVIIEGVETEEQFLKLREMGADAIQGFYFSKPLRSEEAILYGSKTKALSEPAE